MSVNKPFQLLYGCFRCLTRCGVVIGKCGKFWLGFQVYERPEKVHYDGVEPDTKLYQP